MAMMTEKVWAALDSLLRYAKDCELLHPLDETFARNALLAELKLESYEKQKEHYGFLECLNVLCDYAAENGQINDTIAERDLFDTRLMGCVTPRPSEVVRKFWSLYAESPKAATDYFYKLSQDCNYIRRDRIAKDEHWTAQTKYGELEISINLKWQLLQTSAKNGLSKSSAWIMPAGVKSKMRRTASVRNASS